MVQKHSQVLSLAVVADEGLGGSPISRLRLQSEAMAAVSAATSGTELALNLFPLAGEFIEAHHAVIHPVLSCVFNLFSSGDPLEDLSVGVDLRSSIYLKLLFKIAQVDFGFALVTQLDLVIGDALPDFL